MGAIYAESDLEKVNVNRTVNVWRDKIVKEFLRLQDTMSQEEQDELSDILMSLVTDYTKYMGGCNAGCAD